MTFLRLDRAIEFIFDALREFESSSGDYEFFVFIYYLNYLIHN
jgi:hypothetical protein